MRRVPLPLSARWAPRRQAEGFYLLAQTQRTNVLELTRARPRAEWLSLAAQWQRTSALVLWARRPWTGSGRVTTGLRRWSLLSESSSHWWRMLAARTYLRVVWGPREAPHLGSGNRNNQLWGLRRILGGPLWFSPTIGGQTRVLRGIRLFWPVTSDIPWMGHRHLLGGALICPMVMRGTQLFLLGGPRWVWPILWMCLRRGGR